MSRRRPSVRALLAAAVLCTAPFASGDTVQEGVIGVFDLIEPQNFGASLARDLLTLVVGAPDDAPGTGTAGVAYVYGLSSGGAAQQSRIEPLDGQPGDQFGCAVAATVGLAAVGAERVDDAGQDAGAVYVFQRTGNSWAQEEKIIADDGGAQDRFGSAVAIDGDTLAVGAPGDDDVAANAGAVYVYTRQAGPDWVLEQKIPSVAVQANNTFGASLALDGDILVIGAPTETFGQFANAGSVYVFSRNAGEWTEQTRLLSSNTQTNQAFGSALALDGNDLVVGASGANEAFLYNRNGAAWSQPIGFGPGNGAAQSVSFGDSVAIDGDRILVGDSGADVDGAGAGQFHLFDVDSGTVEQQRLLRASTGAAGDGLGSTVALYGPGLYAGAPGRGNGSVYRFGLEGPRDTVRSFFAPARLVVTLPESARRRRRPGLSARGVFDTGAAEVDLTRPGALRVGTRFFDAPNGLTPVRRGRRYVLDTGMGRFIVIPARNGSSRAIFVLNLTGDLTNDVVDEGAVPLRYTTDEFDATGTVEVRNGVYRQRRIPGSVVAPVVDVRRVRAALRGGGRDAFTIVLGFDTNGQTPGSAPHMTVCVGATFREELEPELFALHRRGDRHQVVRRGSGIFRAIVNYARGEIILKARNVDLGDFDEGPVELFTFVRLDAVARSAAVRAVRRRRALRY